MWCTGYRPDLSWIDLPIFDDGGPAHHRGVVDREAGLYLVGRPFLYAMSSGFLRGVSRDAAFVARHISRRDEPSRETPASMHRARARATG